MMAPMPRLSPRLLATLVTQALGRTHKAIGGRGQTAIVAIFGLALFQRLHALLQIADCIDGLPQRFTQGLILLSQSRQFFVCVHIATVSDSLPSWQGSHPAE